MTSLLPRGEVHVWAWTLDHGATDLSSHAALLDSAERDRMSRFHFDTDRARFAISHGNMRRILGAYLEADPAGLRFTVNAYDKPKLIASDAQPPIHFNLSHTSNVGVLAVTLDSEVGVDVETIRTIERDVADANFSARELSDLASLQGKEWLDAFYACWTRKEAILKAEGVGLNLALGEFDVSLLPNCPAELLASRIPRLRRWELHDLKPASEVAGALAVALPQTQVRRFSYPPSL